MQKNYCPNLKKIPLSTFFDAFSDPARIEIILLLLKKEETSCGKCNQNSLSKSTMSHHFIVLHEAGIIQRREEGTVHHLSLRLEEIEARIPGFIGILKKIKGPF